MTNLEHTRVAMYFESPRERGFFCSYGFPPETYNMDTYILREVTYYNDKPLQRLNSDVEIIVCFTLFNENVDVNTIQAKFEGHDSQSFILKFIFALNKVVSHFAVVTSNRISLKEKKKCCFIFWVFATKRGGNSISCKQIV